jgi:hypothetical protein
VTKVKRGRHFTVGAGSRENIRGRERGEDISRPRWGLYLFRSMI